MSSADSLMDTKELAAELKLHVKTVQRYLREGKIRSIRVGREYRIDPEWVDDFLQDTKSD